MAGCTAIVPASEATTAAVVDTWQVLAWPGAGSPKVAVLQVSAPASVFCAHSEPVPKRTVVEADSHASPPSLATHFQPVESVVARMVAFGCSGWVSSDAAGAAACGSVLPPPPPQATSTAAVRPDNARPPTPMIRPFFRMPLSSR